MHLMLVAVGIATLVACAAVLIVVLSRSSRSRRLLLHPLSIIIALLLSGSVLWWQTRPRQIEWDVSRTNNLSDVGWPSGRSEQWYHIAGRSTVRLKVPDGRVYIGHSRNIYIDRHGPRIVRIQVAESPMTLAALADRLSVLSHEWGIDAGPINLWTKRARRDEVPSLILSPPSATSRPSTSITFGIHRSFDDTKPWYIMFTIAWPRDEGWIR